MPLRFILGLHDHQPVGNFGQVFENTYRDAYLPFLELMERFPEVPIALHTSGPLMEWLVANRPDYVDRLRRLVERGQVEVLGGAFYEPILPMIPSRDRVGQVRTYSEYLQGLFSTRIRGMWIAERVWEQCLVADLAAAGIEYTVLDDFHFRQAGLDDAQLLSGYFLTEDEGELLRVFPNSEPMRYLVPWQSVNETIRWLGELAKKSPDAIVVCADDGEKFGGWPKTHQHCYADGYLEQLFEALRSNRSWIHLCTFAQVLDETAPAGTVWLPECSYREMTEWVLPPARRTSYDRVVKGLQDYEHGPEAKQFVRGGYWRNFRTKYPELQEMYARMIEVSHRVEAGSRQAGPGTETARRELYRAQCNCSWWHGAFGGLYLPHLRHAIYHHLLAAENAVLEHDAALSRRVAIETADFNLDGSTEIRLENRKLAAYFAPQRGGCLYELDLRPIKHNLLATLARRPEPYHETIRQHGLGLAGGSGGVVPDQALFKQSGLEKLLHYDAYLRKSLVDHFYEPRVALDDLAACAEDELGDFVTAPYDQRVQQGERGAEVMLSRSGIAAGHPVRLLKSIRLQPGSDTLEVRYLLEGIPRGRKLRFGVEWNFAGMAAGADDRYFYHEKSKRAGQLQTLQDLRGADRIGLVDEWLGLDASLNLSRPGGIWAFPVQTVSQSEGGFELVHQSTVVLTHWLPEPDAHGRWEVTLRLKLDMSRAEARTTSRD